MLYPFPFDTKFQMRYEVKGFFQHSNPIHPMKNCVVVPVGAFRTGAQVHQLINKIKSNGYAVSPDLIDFIEDNLVGENVMLDCCVILPREESKVLDATNVIASNSTLPRIDDVLVLLSARAFRSIRQTIEQVCGVIITSLVACIPNGSSAKVVIVTDTAVTLEQFDPAKFWGTTTAFMTVTYVR